MIAIYTRSNKVQEAMKILETMPSPTITTFYFIINAFGKMGDVDNMFAVFEKMKQMSIHNLIILFN